MTHGAPNVARVEGLVAHDAAVEGYPVYVGGKAVDFKATPADVAAADLTHWLFNRQGIPFILGGHPNTERLSGKYDSAQTDTSLKTINSGECFVITAASVYLDHGADPVQVLLEFGSTRIIEHGELPPGSGLVEGSGAGIIAIGAEAEDPTFTCENPGSYYVTVHITGFKIEI
jgi:hypothetical protein